MNTVQDGDEFEVMVEATVSELIEGTFEVPMTLQVDATSKAEALDRAMAWRDAIGMGGMFGGTVSERLAKLGFEWHLHHPWGC